MLVCLHVRVPERRDAEDASVRGTDSLVKDGDVAVVGVAVHRVLLHHLLAPSAAKVRVVRAAVATAAVVVAAAAAGAGLVELWVELVPGRALPAVLGRVVQRSAVVCIGLVAASAARVGAEGPRRPGDTLRLGNGEQRLDIAHRCLLVGAAVQVAGAVRRAAVLAKLGHDDGLARRLQGCKVALEPADRFGRVIFLVGAHIRVEVVDHVGGLDVLVELQKNNEWRPENLDRGRKIISTSVRAPHTHGAAATAR